jgi:excisionase family DNA binding protein
MDVLTASINDTAKALGLGRTSVYSLIKNKRLDVVKIGRRTLVRVDSIQRLLADS